MKEFKSTEDILNFAIEAEQDAFEFYSKLASGATSEQMKMVFEQFAQEESGHKAKLLKILETGMVEMTHEKVADLKIADYTVSVEANENMTYQDALIVAMKKEKAAFRLYLALSERAPSASLKDLFMMLATEESKHKLRFEIEYDEFVLREN
jgi:rubrerythrin